MNSPIQSHFKFIVLFILFIYILNGLNAQVTDKINSLNQQLKTSSQKDKSEIYLQLANLYYSSDLKKSFNCANASQLIAKELKIKDIQANAFDLLGKISEKQFDQKNALKFYEQEIDVRETMPQDTNLAWLYYNAASMNHSDKKDKRASILYVKSLSLAKKFNLHDLIPFDYEALFSMDYNIGKYKEAMDYFKQYMLIKDSVYVKQNATVIAKIKSKYEAQTQKQNAQIGKLNEINSTITAHFDSTTQLKDAEIGHLNELTAAQKAELKYTKLVITEKERERNYLLAIVGFVLIIIVLLNSLYFSNRRKNQRLKLQNEELEFQKEEITTQRDDIEMKIDIIAQKNKDITNSIQYALRIQQAILPTDIELKRLFHEFFVLYKPKDIVSGDYYWITNTNEDKAFFAVADCTGHGVPGGFMSMVGTLKLNEIINKEDVAESLHPAEILKQLDNEIKKALHQTDSMFSTQDGMDIAICEFDFLQKKLIYSGANIPLWLCRNNGLLVEYQPTRKGIGGFYDGHLRFEDIEVQLEDDDMFYLFSDGFEDQFGGPNKRKLMRKNLRTVLSSLHQDEIFSQKEKLGRYFEDWKKNEEQVDDVLVFGFKNPFKNFT